LVLQTAELKKTQKEVADMLGISQSYISRLERRLSVGLERDKQNGLIVKKYKKN